jgi:hypothetical protein
MGQSEEIEYVSLKLRISMQFLTAEHPDDRFAVDMIGIGIDRKVQADKCPGKAMSYAVKYAYLKALALETGDDPDLEQHRGDEPPAPAEDSKPDVAPADGAQVIVKSDGTARGMFNVCAQTIAPYIGMKYPAFKAKAWRAVRDKFGYDNLDALTILQGGEICEWMWAEYAPEHRPQATREPGQEG